MEILGYQRKDGRKGIRNVILIAYLVECAHFVASEIAYPYKKQGVQVIGFGGCYPNSHAAKVMSRLCTHPNVGGVLLVSLGCESFNREELSQNIAHSGRPVKTLVIQQSGGTLSTINQGKKWVEETLSLVQNTKRVPLNIKDLIVGTICGGSDATSGISGNPAVGLTLDKIVDQQGTAIFEETGEMVGCKENLVARAKTKALSIEIEKSLLKAERYYTILGHGSFALGNAEGGLSTIEEKSLGAYTKSGSQLITGLIKPGDIPPQSGLYLLDVVPDGEPRFGFPNINDNMEITELIASGCHIILFVTGRGSVVGSAISPVIKICANPETYQNLKDDMDINAGKIISTQMTLAEVAEEIYEKILTTAAGSPTASEQLGHQEFVVGYKTFEPIGPSCLAR